MTKSIHELTELGKQKDDKVKPTSASQLHFYILLTWPSSMLSFQIRLLTRNLSDRDAQIETLNEKILELEDALGEQEEEHQAMVVKLAQSLDTLANRKSRVKRQKVKGEPDKSVVDQNTSLESLEDHLKNAQI